MLNIVVLFVSFVLISSVNGRTTQEPANSTEIGSQESDNNRIFLQNTQDNSSNSLLPGQQFVANISLILSYRQFPSKIEVNSSSCTDYDLGFCENNDNDFELGTRFSDDFDEEILPKKSYSHHHTKVHSTTPPPYVQGEPMCKISRRLVFPNTARNVDNNWRLVVNERNFKQAIHFEECLNTGKPCEMSSHFPQGYITKCEQQKNTRTLLILDKNGEVRQELFNLPSCCKCILYAV